MVYPDGEWVGWLYDRAGRVRLLANVAGSPIYMPSLTYDVFGRPRVLAHGNGITDTRSYETSAATNYRLKRITAAGASTLLQYNYDGYEANRRLTHVADVTALPSPPYPANISASVTFGYDALGRLLSADDVDAGTRSYTYDTWGNITAKEGTTITYSATKPHRPTSATGTLASTFAHDANGNRTGNTVGRGPFAYHYDLDDRLRLIDRNGDGVRFTYDYLGQRTKEIRGPVVGTGADASVDEVGAEITYHLTDASSTESVGPFRFR
jgi:YD repeat-containing protein